jgi:hypothetical protein
MNSLPWATVAAIFTITVCFFFLRSDATTPGTSQLIDTD